MKQLLILPLSILALASLSACGKKQEESINETVADPMHDQLANAPVAALPPAVKSSKTYRCKSGGLVKVDFFADDLTANITPDGAPSPVHLTATEKGKPFEADGYKVEGSASPLTITLPGKSAETCKS